VKVLPLSLLLGLQQIWHLPSICQHTTCSLHHLTMLLLPLLLLLLLLLL
jgi:hypothetical protein